MQGVWLFILLVLPLAQAALQINEIMYDPGQCSDAQCEWVELWNEGQEAVNLSGCYFEEKELEGNIPADAYLIVARNREEFATVFGDVEHLIERSFTLRNDGDMVTMNGTCSDGAEYTGNLAAGNNKTLEKNAAGMWDESTLEGGTPGQENSIYRHSREFGDLLINEILPDPFRDDDALKNAGEWIELYNQGGQTLDLEGLEFYDAAGNKLTISRDKLLDDSMLLFPKDYVVIYRDGDADFTLNNNDYEEVWLCPEDEDCREGENHIDMISFSGSTPGMSWSNIGGNWFQSAPTPNERNHYNGSCNWGLQLDIPQAILTPEEFQFNLTVRRFHGFEENITVTGMIETIDGEVIREYTPWTNERIVSEQKRTYSPNLREGVYQVSFAMAPLSCPDSHTTDNRVSRLAAINPEYRRFASSVTIREIDIGSDGKAEWGDQVMVELEVYKGNTTKTVLEAWVEFGGETVSSRSKLRLEDPFQAYSVSFPVQLYCQQEDGTAKLIVEGLDLYQEREFAVEGIDAKVCREAFAIREEEQRETAGKQKGTTIISLAEAPAVVAPGETFRLQVAGEGDGTYNIWSYAYRGNKCYSCNGKERDANAQKVVLDGQKVIDFLLQLDEEMEEGEYKLKVKWLKEGQKTEKELTVPFMVQFHPKILEQPTGFFATAEGVASAYPSTLQEVKSGFIAYQSSSEKAKTFIPLFLAIAFGLVSVILLRRNA